MCVEFQFEMMKRVLEVDNGDSCTTMWIYLMPQSYTFKICYDGKFCFVYVTTIINKSTTLQLKKKKQKATHHKHTKNSYMKASNVKLSTRIWRVKSKGFLGCSMVKNPSASAGDIGLIPDPGTSHIVRATKPTCHNYLACALELGNQNYWIPTCPRAHTLQLESSPHLLQLEKICTVMKA